MSLWLIIAPLFALYTPVEHRALYTAPPPAIVSQTGAVEAVRVEPTPSSTPTSNGPARAITAPQTNHPGNWDALLQQYFGANWAYAKHIMLCESSGNPNAIGPTDSQGYNPIGLFQIKNFAGRPSTAELKDGAINIAWAAKMSNGGANWNAWECR